MYKNNMAMDILHGCEIAQLDDDIDLNNGQKYIKLEPTQGQKIHISALMNQLPALVGMDTLSKTMVLRFPEGIQGTLMQLKSNGGHTTTLRSLETGQINGTAWLEPTTPQAICLGAFTAMSVVSGQYFLSQINSSLAQISSGLDRILEFLYGDKRAELLSEVNFIQFAYKNYKSVMEHSEQRIATLISLQNAKKVALKDIEFYLSDLNSIITDKKNGDISSTVPKMVRTKDCLDLSLQLYIMSNLLEVYYSENYDYDYISFVQSEASVYISKCEKKELNCFGQLQHLLAGIKDGIFTKVGKADYIQQVDGIVTELETSVDSPLQVTLQSGLAELSKEKCFYQNEGGEV